MGYRFKAGEKSVTKGVRRIAAAEFAQIQASLADPSLPLARKVHEARKGTKRLRALIRLVAPVFPEAPAEIAALRAAARELSALRDTGALPEAAAALPFPDDLAGKLAAALAAKPSGSAAAHRRLLEAAQGLTASRHGRVVDFLVKGGAALIGGLAAQTLHLLLARRAAR